MLCLPRRCTRPIQLLSFSFWAWRGLIELENHTVRVGLSVVNLAAARCSGGIFSRCEDRQRSVGWALSPASVIGATEQQLINTTKTLRKRKGNAGSLTHGHMHVSRYDV